MNKIPFTKLNLKVLASSASHETRRRAKLLYQDRVGLNWESDQIKLVTSPAHDMGALAKMRQALDELVVEGIRTNAALHRELVTDTSFMAGGVSIHYLESKLEHER